MRCFEVQDIMRKAASFACLLLIAADVGAALTSTLDKPAEMTALVPCTTLLDVTRAGDRIIAVGDYGVVVFSDDEGASWAQGSVPVSVTLTAVDFATPEKGWAVGHDSVIIHSSDGGKAWSRQLDGFAAARLAMEAIDDRAAELESQSIEESAEPGWALQDELDMLDFLRSEAEWAIGEGPNRPFLDVLFLDDEVGHAIGAFGDYFVTTNGGASWHSRSPWLPNPDGLHLYGISSGADNALLIVGEYGLVLRRGGVDETWEFVRTPYEGSFFGILGQDEKVLAYGLRGNAVYSADFGTNWHPVATGTRKSLVGGTLLGEEELLLVGLGGTTVRGALGAAQLIPQDLPSRVSMAATIPLKNGSSLVAGTHGILKLTTSGEEQRFQCPKNGDET